MLFRTTPALLRTALRGLALAALVAGSFSVASTARAQGKTVKKVPIRPTDASSGKEMYTSYCAACHGPAGKGNGPAASEFKVTLRI